MSSNTFANLVASSGAGAGHQLTAPAPLLAMRLAKVLEDMRDTALHLLCRVVVIMTLE